MTRGAPHRALKVITRYPASAGFFRLGGRMARQVNLSWVTGFAIVLGV